MSEDVKTDEMCERMYDHWRMSVTASSRVAIVEKFGTVRTRFGHEWHIGGHYFVMCFEVR